MNMPVIISSFDIFLRSNIGSKMAVNSVSAERQTKATETVAILMDKKKSTQCPATMAPVKNNFKNEIIWKRGSMKGGKAISNHLGRNHDTIFWYTKSDSFTFNKQFIPYSEDYIK